LIREKFVAARGDTFDVSSKREEIERVAHLFGEYLARTSRGAAGSKHRALGPVAKALQHARTVGGDALLGYARRVHEQTTNSTYPAGAVEKLDEGLRRLDALLTESTGRGRVQILERVEYATYYDVRRRSVEFLRGWDDAKRAAEKKLGAGPRTLKLARSGECGEDWKTVGDDYVKRAGLAAELAEEEDGDE